MTTLPEFEGNAAAAQDFYAQIVLTTAQQRALFAQRYLARLVIAAVKDCRSAAPGSLWAYRVLPDSLRLIVGPADDDALDAYVTLVKVRTAARVIARIQRADDDSLDAVLMYNPVWGGALYHLWEAGYHKAVFWTPYQLSNAIYALTSID